MTETMTDPQSEKQIASTKQEVAAILMDADTLVVVTPADHERAVAFLGRIAKALKESEKLRKFFVDPLNARIKAINTRFKLMTAPAEGADEVVRAKVKAYLRAKEDKRQAEERRRQAEHEEATKASRALGGGVPKPAQPLQVEAAPKTVVTESGSSTAVEKWDYEVLDLKAVPWDLLRAEVKRAEVLRKINAEGVRAIPGLRIFPDIAIRVQA